MLLMFVSMIVSHLTTMSGVLHARFRMFPSYKSIPFLEIEIHVQPVLGTVSSPGTGETTRVVHVLLRIDTFGWEIVNPAYTDLVASAQSYMATLPYLQTVTLETMELAESTEMAERLTMLRGNGKLRRRTCQEAEAIVLEAFTNPTTNTDEQGILSPLWYPDGPTSEIIVYSNYDWYVNGSCLTDTRLGYSSAHCFLMQVAAQR